MSGGFGKASAPAADDTLTRLWRSSAERVTFMVQEVVKGGGAAVRHVEMFLH